MFQKLKGKNISSDSTNWKPVDCRDPDGGDDFVKFVSAVGCGGEGEGVRVVRWWWGQEGQRRGERNYLRLSRQLAQHSSPDNTLHFTPHSTPPHHQSFRLISNGFSLRKAIGNFDGLINFLQSISALVIFYSVTVFVFIIYIFMM